MQCGNFSEDFFSAPIPGTPKRTNLKKIRPLPDNVLIIHPYTGLDYSRFDISCVTAVVHGTYHSGTVCTDKLILFAKHLSELDIPLFLAPSEKTPDQYASVFELESGSTVYLVNESTESVYGKILSGICFGLEGDKLVKFVID